MPPESFDSKLTRIVGPPRVWINGVEISHLVETACPVVLRREPDIAQTPQAEIDATVRRMLATTTTINPDGGRR